MDYCPTGGIGSFDEISIVILLVVPLHKPERKPSLEHEDADSAPTIRHE